MLGGKVCALRTSSGINASRGRDKQRVSGKLTYVNVFVVSFVLLALFIGMSELYGSSYISRKCWSIEDVL